MRDGLAEAVLAALREHLDMSKVRSAHVVGSAARGELQPSSDIDVVVDVPPGPPTFKDVSVDREFRIGSTHDALSIIYRATEYPLHIITAESTTRLTGESVRVY